MAKFTDKLDSIDIDFIKNRKCFYFNCTKKWKNKYFAKRFR